MGINFELPERITTKEEAENYLKLLFDNGMSYHPDDSAHDIIWGSDEPHEFILNLTS